MSVVSIDQKIKDYKRLHRLRYPFIRVPTCTASVEDDGEKIVTINHHPYTENELDYLIRGMMQISRTG